MGDYILYKKFNMPVSVVCVFTLILQRSYLFLFWLILFLCKWYDYWYCFQTILGPNNKKIVDKSKKTDVQTLFEKNDFPYAIEDEIEHVSATKKIFYRF